ncbi:hypothetical protein KSP39_PZI004182 [Platanthera zijinensis]|uniref:Uncharacterized protein n=1 Tax=Platanthera zijinensis TaxID=2320716 RepID=A0AAP0BXX4_9ASPA
MKPLYFNSILYSRTLIILVYVHKSFSLDCKTTTTDNLVVKEIVIAKRPIWDIPGKERFKNLAVFYAWLDGCILVFDVNIKKTFETLNK